jgi:tryptophanyl-tRNA synthetase
MSPLLLDSLESLKDSPDTFFIFEEKVAAPTRKKIEKYAEKSERFDAPKKAADNTAFDIANALQRGDKKKMWVAYMTEIAKRSEGPSKKRAEDIVVELVELPHRARREGCDMEYALERFVLARM